MTAIPVPIPIPAPTATQIHPLHLLQVLTIREDEVATGIAEEGGRPRLIRRQEGNELILGIDVMKEIGVRKGARRRGRRVMALEDDIQNHDRHLLHEEEEDTPMTLDLDPDLDPLRLFDKEMAIGTMIDEEVLETELMTVDEDLKTVGMFVVEENPAHLREERLIWFIRIEEGFREGDKKKKETPAPQNPRKEARIRYVMGVGSFRFGCVTPSILVQALSI